MMTSDQRHSAPVSCLYALLLLALTGCANYYAKEPNLFTRVQQWNKDQLYGQSISILELVKPNHPQYSTLQNALKETQALALDYEHQALKDAEALVSDHQWQPALSLLEQAIEKLPFSHPLKNARKSIKVQRQKYIEDLEFQLLIMEGKLLPNLSPLIKEIAAANPKDTKAQQRAVNMTLRTRKAANSLLKQGLIEADKNNHSLAHEYLALAHQLDPNDNTTQALKEVRLKINSHAIQRQKAHEKQQLIRIKQSLSEFHDLINKKDYSKAKNLLNQMHAYREKIPEYTQLELNLQQAIDQKTRLSIELGQGYYSQGKFEKAYKTWRESLILTPNNTTLLNHIERVQKVLESLRRLNDSEQANDFPVESSR